MFLRRPPVLPAPLEVRLGLVAVAERPQGPVVAGGEALAVEDPCTTT